jgi:DMSO/TMAO reductase YedYZ molybdopterin-dependent catalytic subunit
VRLDRLLDPAAGESIVVRSITGYSRRFPRSDAPGLLIATLVGDAPLSAGHGAPARLVAPGRRGVLVGEVADGDRRRRRAVVVAAPVPLT